MTGMTNMTSMTNLVGPMQWRSMLWRMNPPYAASVFLVIWPEALADIHDGFVPPPRLPSLTMSTEPLFNADEVVFGVECEFTDPVAANVGWGITARYRTAVARRCAWSRGLECRFDRRSVEVRSRQSPCPVRLFPHRDHCVLEIAIDPLTIQQIEAARPLLASLVWDAAADVGLAPGTDEVNRWSAHLNFSWPRLRVGRDAGLLLRYLVDFNNHPELAMGAVGGDIRNAPPLAIFSDRAQQAMQGVVADYNRAPEAEDAFTVAAKIRRQVYGERFQFGLRGRNDHYNAVNLCHVNRLAGHKRPYAIDSPVRVEQRASYMPPSADHLFSQCRIIAARLAYLSKQTGPIEYRPPRFVLPAASMVFQRRGTQQGVDATAIAKCFLRYLAETGLNAAEHVPFLVNPEVREAVERLFPCSYRSPGMTTAKHER
jgi:hypothetical protein